MKLNTLSAAISAAVAVLACPGAIAAGLVPSDYNAVTTQDFYISGASAQDNGLLGQARSLCLAGTLSQFNISNNNVYFCNPDVGTGTGQINLGGGKTKMAIYKYSVGGSGNGIGPVAAGASLPFLDLTKLTISSGTTTGFCTLAASGPDFTDTLLPAYTKYNCASSSSITTNQVTKIGFSDVEPDFFAPASVTGSLTKQSVTSLIFGVPVSKKVRDKLQAYQGKTIGGEAEADLPSLSSAQLTTIFTQAGQTWSGIGYPMTSNQTAANTTLAALVTALGDDGIYVARRVNSSGTQKTFEALVARASNGEGFKSCTGNTTDTFVASSLGNDNTAAGDPASACTNANLKTVFSGSGGGDVRTCLIAHNADNRGAVGLLTTEDKAGANAWRFVAVDGVSPTQRNTVSGAYRLYTENTFQYLPATNTGNYGVLIGRLKTDFTNPAIIAALNGAYTQTWGRGGLLALVANQALPSPVVITDDASVAASPINPWTKVVGTDTNNCQNPKLFN
jgi:hypothetical protein